MAPLRSAGRWTTAAVSALATAVGGLAGAVVVSALLSGTSASAASQFTAGSVGAGSQPTVTVSGRNVTLSWTAATNATTYTVARNNVSPGGLAATLTATCVGSVASTTCTDQGLPLSSTAATTWTYVVTPSNQNWLGAVSPTSAVVTIPGPALSLAATSFTSAGGSTTATVSSFFDTEQVTFCLDTTTAPCPGAQLGTVNVPATGGTATATITIPVGVSVGAHVVYATGSFGSAPSATITVGASAAQRLAFTTQPPANGSVTAGAGSTFKVAVQDAQGNLVTTDNSTKVSLAIAVNPGGSALSCTNIGGNGPVQVVAGEATFTCSLNKVGNGYQLTASSSPTLSAATSNSFNVVPSEVGIKLVFTSAPFTTAVSTSATAAFTISLQDGFDNPVLAGAGGVVVNLSSNSTGTTKFAATSGGTAVTSLTIPQGATSITGYYADTAAGTPTITATATAITAATQTETITAATATASKLVFSSNPFTTTASTTASAAFTITLQDNLNNPVTAGAGGVIVNLSSNSTGTTKFAATSGGTAVTSLTVPQGATSITGYYADTAAGTPTITATATAITAATQTETITAAAPMGLTLTGVTGTKNGTSSTCEAVSSNYSCTWSGGNASNSITASVAFVDAFGNLAVQSSSSASTITLVMGSSGTLTPTSLSVATGQTTTSATFTLAMSANNNTAATITFGTFTLTINLNF